MNLKSRLSIFFLFSLALFGLSSNCLALSASELRFYGQNNILFYAPEEDNCLESSSSSATSSSSASTSSAEGAHNLSAEQVQFVEKYHDAAVLHSINYGIPWETVVAQGILESASGSSQIAREKNNFFGVGAFDSCPYECAKSYSTPEEGWEGYYKNIVQTSVYRENGVFSGDTITDPIAYLRAIKAAGYATDPSYVENTTPLINSIIAISKDRGWESSAELAEKHPEWKQNAEKNRQGASTSSSNSSSGTSNASSSVKLCTPGSKSSSPKSSSSKSSTEGTTASSELISGGMTLSEAEAFMETYASESDKFATGNLSFSGATVLDAGCPSGTLNNCSAFTQWFLNKYTSLGPSGANLVQGSQAVQQYTATGQLTYGGKTPKPYAVVSMGPYSGTADGWPNHTAIVLGIDSSSDQIIIGEASCGSGNGGRYYRPQAKVYSLTEYTNSSSEYGPTYAYTDSVLKGLK